MLASAGPTENNGLSAEMLYLIDVIERLGIGYHFESEIEQLLRGVHQNTCPTHDDDDLNTVALRFRLLRQHGYYVPTDVFKKFQEGGQFKKELGNDTEAMLNLYEAAYLRTREESILDEAIEFTKEELNAKAVELATTFPYLSERVNRALKRPLRKVVEKVEHLFFISSYEKLENHNQCLVKLAKLNFNVLQNLYQTELRLLTKWWIELDTPRKLPYARDKLVESYFWALGTMWEPKHSLARIYVTKVTQIGTLLDDTYDVHGTIEELEMFTAAVQRWDTSMKDLKDYMIVIFQSIVEVYDEIESVTSKEGRPWCVEDGKRAVDNVVRLYLEEVRWFDKDWVPTVEEYRQISSLSTCYEWMIYAGLCGMGGSVSKEVFEWLFSKPNLLIATTDLCRLMDDVVSNEPTSNMEEDWKIMNEELLNPPAHVPNEVLQIFLRLGHIMDVLYKEIDGYTNSNTTTQDMLTALLVTPFPI
ncbi:Probable terpene synthase 3 [Linum grandiflorum]